MKDIIYVNGIEIKTNNITCKNCGVVSVPEYKYLESNRSVQMRCTECGAWNGNYKYTTSEKYVMPFGKHKGKFVCELPFEYLSWLYENTELRGGLLTAVETAIDKIERTCGYAN